MKQFFIFTLTFFVMIACQNKTKSENPQLQKQKGNTIIKVSNKPLKPVFSNLEIDTTYLFGVWATNVNDPNADFIINKDEYYIADHIGKSNFPYRINKDQIEIFFDSETKKGIIKSVTKDSLIILWDYFETPSKFVRFNNVAYKMHEVIDYYKENCQSINKKIFYKDYYHNFVKLKTTLCQNFNEQLFKKFIQIIASKKKCHFKNEIIPIFNDIYDCHSEKAAIIIHQQHKDKLFLKILNKRYFNEKIYLNIEQKKFKLIMPDTTNIRKILKQKNDTGDEIYIYLSKNYHKTSKKKKIDNLSNYRFIDYNICHFTQQFEQIDYTYKSCEEGKGSTTKILLPNSDLEKVRKWIELINSTTDDNKRYEWNSKGMKFEPKEAEPGCYYEITQLKNQIKITRHCGC